MIEREHAHVRERKRNRETEREREKDREGITSVSKLKSEPFHSDDDDTPATDVM